ncbi:hypothetical protein PBY51_009145 [Eleginops maclovinus]|uniref:Uncharacterized protein n=2 Tax=Eleginops maclovinus TaxID=56733 RepID=A0AAN8A389_ELEMC|nr:hypothetical protein PBY51_009145 [Eleginops maclovinus]
MLVQVSTSLLCSSGGSLPLLDLHQMLLQRCRITEEQFCSMVQQCPRFLLDRGPGPAGRLRAEDCSVLARTSLRLCTLYPRGGCSESESGRCPNLHLCKYFLLGTCRFGKGRRACRLSHDLRSGHNAEALRGCMLQELQEEQLMVLMVQNDPALLPEVCVHYNKGGCSFQEDCTKLHLCQHFLRGGCRFGSECTRQHGIDPPGRRLLEERGLSEETIQQLPLTYRNIHVLTTAEKPPDLSVGDVGETEEKTEICLHFLRNRCRFQNGCRRVHFPLPYRWEAFDGRTWTDLQDMEDIERDFHDLFNAQSLGAQPVDFLQMIRGPQPVRRLSTASSVTKPPHYTLTTEWLWFYKGDRGGWVEYGKPDEKQRTTSETSRTLEERFLSDSSAEVRVVKGHREYVLSFRDMYQRNLKHNTRRRVRRRPRLISEPQEVPADRT